MNSLPWTIMQWREHHAKTQVQRNKERALGLNPFIESIKRVYNEKRNEKS